MRRKQKLYRSLTGLIIVVILALVSSQELFQNKSFQSKQDTQGQFTGSNFEVFEKQVKYPITVAKVSDGDTFHAIYNDREFKVRLLMINTPELAKNNQPAQPYAQKAYDRTQQLLSQAKVIEASFDKGDYTDKYDRALMYVYIDGKLLQQYLLEEGYAKVQYVNKPNNTLESEFRTYESIAKNKKIGIWK